MYYESDYGVLTVRVKTGECLYGRINLEGTNETFEAWIYFNSDGNLGDVEMRSSEFGLLGFQIDPLTGEAVGTKNTINVGKLVLSRLYRATCALFNELESAPEIKVRGFVEGILVAVMLKSPLTVSQGQRFKAGQLQRELFDSYCTEEAFEKCHLAPQVSTFFEQWFFFDYFKLGMALWKPQIAGGREADVATRAMSPGALQRQLGYQDSLAG